MSGTVEPAGAAAAAVGPTGETPAAMVSNIADVSYRNYDGPLRAPGALRWWSIAAATLKSSIRRVGFWIAGGLILMFYFVLAMIHFLSQAVREQAAASNMMVNGPTNPYALTLYQGITWSLLPLFIAALTIGSSAISADNRSHALLIYFSRPVTRLDYLLGKWFGLFIPLAIISAVPALLLFLAFVAVYAEQGFLKQNPTLILKLLPLALLPAAVHTSLVLGFSAWSKTPRLAGASYAGFYLVAWVLCQQFGGIALQQDRQQKHPQVAAVLYNLSPDGVVCGVGMNAFDVTPQQVADRKEGRRRGRRRKEAAEENTAEAAVPTVPERPNLPAMLVLGALTIGLPLFAAHQKVRAVEVVSG